MKKKNIKFAWIEMTVESNSTKSEKQIEINERMKNKQAIWRENKHK